MADTLFNGPPEVVQEHITEAAGADGEDIAVLGPRILDGVSYANVRDTKGSFKMPEGCSPTGPQLSQALLGGWFDEVAAPKA